MFRSLRTPVAAGLLAAWLVPTVAAQEGRPKFSFLQQDEDWSNFVAADPPEDPFDPIKHVALDADGDVWVSFGGRVESRFEAWRSFAFGPPGVDHDDTFTVSRALLHADLHVGDSFRMYVEGKSAQATDRSLPGGRRTLDMDTLEFQQVFADAHLPLGEGEVRFRAGRQELLFGKQRLVSPLPWGNTLRHWDAVRADWTDGAWSTTAFASYFVPVDKTGTNEVNRDLTLFGVLARHKAADSPRLVELYAFGNERPAVTINGTSGNEARATLGGRYENRLGDSMDVDLEAAYQLGEVGDQDVAAWMFASQIGLRRPEWAGEPRFFVGLDIGSGDDAAGGDVGTFHQLFPLGHAYLGHADVLARQNVLDLSLGGIWKTDAKSKLVLALHHFRAMDTSDAIYAVNGAPFRTGYTSKDIGLELDARYDRRFGRHLSGYAGYAHFFAGSAIEQSGPSDDIDFLYLGVSYSF